MSKASDEARQATADADNLAKLHKGEAVYQPLLQVTGDIGTVWVDFSRNTPEMVASDDHYVDADIRNLAAVAGC